MFENLNKAWESIQSSVEDWTNHGIDMLPNFIVAVIVLLLFILFAKFLGKILAKRLPNVSKNDAVNQMLVSLTKVLIIAFGVITCLGILHLDKTVATILAGVGLVGLALSFAFQHAAHNLLSGIILATRSTINVGHYIEAGGVEGIVRRIGLRATYIENTKGQIVAVPNKLLTDEKYSDYTSLGHRRIDIEIHVNYASDMDMVKQVTLDAVEKMSQLHSDFSPEFFIHDMADFSIQCTLRIWIPFTNHPPAYLAARHEAINRILNAYKANNIDIPFPTHLIRKANA